MNSCRVCSAILTHLSMKMKERGPLESLLYDGVDEILLSLFVACDRCLLYLFASFLLLFVVAAVWESSLYDGDDCDDDDDDDEEEEEEEEEGS